MCRRLRWFGKLDLLQALSQFPGVGLLVSPDEGLEARTQGLALGQLDPGFQSLKHPLHGPALPLVEGDPGDLELAADLAGFGAFGPHRQHRLGFVLGREAGSQVAWSFGFGTVV